LLGPALPALVEHRRATTDVVLRDAEPAHRDDVPLPLPPPAGAVQLPAATRVPGHPDPALDAPRAVEVRPETAHPAHAARGERLDVVRLDAAARAAVLGARARHRPLADDEPHATHSAHPPGSRSLRDRFPIGTTALLMVSSPSCG